MSNLLRPRCVSMLALFAALGIGWLAAPAAASVQFSGPISPASPPPIGDSESTLEIGFGNNPNLVDPRATVIVDDGSTLEFDEAYVGSDEGFFGRLIVSGDNSLLGNGTKFVVEENGNAAEPALQVGREGDGYLLVEKGGWVDVEDQDGDLTIGNALSGVGRVVVRDAFSLVSVGQNLTVGDQGIGRLEVSGGGIVRTEDATSASVTIGDNALGFGEVYVDGAGSRLVAADDLVVGGAGHGLLVISGGAIVDADNSSSPQATVGTQGRVTLAGGTLAINTLAISGVLGGSGVVQGDGAGSGVVSTTETGRIDVGPGDLLRIDDDVTNQGSVNLVGGEAEFLNGFTNNALSNTVEAMFPPGRIVLQGGRARFLGGLTNDGVVAATEGANNVHGEVANGAGGAVIVSSDTVLTFHDDFTDGGGMVDVIAGGAAIFLADATFTATSTLSLGLDDNPLTADGALVEVAGAATLGGDLIVTTPDGFTATLGDTFTLVSAAGGLNGTFDSTVLPTLGGGLEFGLLTGPNVVTLEVQVQTVATLEGDFNGDGVVDAADYTFWRDGLVPTTQLNYDLWSQNLGAVAGQSTSQAIPEPTAAALLALAAACGVGRVRR